MHSSKTPRLNDEEILSPSSDEKMDTGSESFRSQETPNSVLSSDFDDNPDQSVLRLQNPEHEVLRLTDQETNHNNSKTTVLKCQNEEWNDSLILKMSNLNVNSPKVENRPRNLGISPPKFCSTLISTTNHPLMGLGSPEENYPDIVPKKLPKVDDEKDLSLSSIEDEKNIETNGFYSPQQNTSKNNLYFSENFVTAESQMLSDSRFENVSQNTSRLPERRRIVPRFTDLKVTSHKNLSNTVEDKENGALKEFIDRNKITSQSTPKSSIVIPETDKFNSVADWCESPSNLRNLPNFELPIEMSSSLGLHNQDPDVVSSSTQEDRSAYQALLDPYTGSVALRHTVPKTSPSATRRRIQLPPEDDRCSLDSVSGCSMESEEEPPPPLPQNAPAQVSDDDDTKRSKSSNTVSECSDPIPEYSASEELANERAWITVPNGAGLSACDMKVIEPYKRVLSHGGYEPRGAAVIVFSACHLPDCARADYRYVMDNLFLYVIWTLERLVTDEYVLVYLHGSAGARRLPSFHWLHECYKLIDRRLKHLYLVHPTFWLKSFVILTKPFVSSKFFRKLSYVRNLEELHRLVPVEPNAIPDLVKQYDATKR
ncbi:hypothetical protein ACJJTC_011000 [Scirpophaga incertulas]